jgi:hypothetical protein
VKHILQIKITLACQDIQQQSSWWHSPRRYCDTYKRNNRTVWTIEIWRRLHAGYVKVKVFPYEISITAVYCPPRHNLKKEHFETFFETLRPKFIAGGDYNSKHTLWGSRLTKTKRRELLKVIQEKNCSFLSTGTPTYWPTDGKKIPDLLDFFVTNGISSKYTDIQSSYDLTSDHSPIIVRKPTPRLPNSKTNCDTYRQIV